MAPFRRLLARRFLFGYLAVALLFGLAILHPYPRQSLFGPTIHGEPWCSWEARVRYVAHWDENQKTLLAKTRKRLGFDEVPLQPRDFRGEDTLPLLLELADDPDSAVRDIATHVIAHDWSVRSRSALPVLRRALADRDPYTRHAAACGIWRVEQDPTMIALLAGEIKGNDERQRQKAAGALASMYRDVPDPELRALIISYARHADPSVRCSVLYSIGGNTEGIPLLLEGLKDNDADVRVCAAHHLQFLRSDARAALPALERCLADANERVRMQAAGAIMYIDWVRYVHLRETGKIK